MRSKRRYTRPRIAGGGGPGNDGERRGRAITIPGKRPADRRATCVDPAKLELYRAMRAAGLSKAQLAARLHWISSQVTRPFDGRRAARLDKVEAALAALGRRLVVTSEAA